MPNLEKLQKKLHTALKLSGFLVRRQFSDKIIEKFIQQHIDLDDNTTFDNFIKNICNSLEKQCLADKSIEWENIERAIEVCLHSGCDKNETIFNVIDAFSFPKLTYDPDRKMYFHSTTKPKLLSDSITKSELFRQRYNTILQRTQRNFKNKVVENDANKLQLQTVDYLLTVTQATLDRVLILGSLLQVSEGKYFLEDPTGMVELNLTHARFHGGFFVENMFVLVNGFYEDKILQVSTIVLPPGEEFKDSRPSFHSINYFGGPSSSLLRESNNLQEQLNRNSSSMILFFSDVWLDHPLIFEKFELLFSGLQETPPVAFVFMGNFMSESHGLEKMETLRKLFKQLADLIVQYPTIVQNSHFIFVPGMSDPCTPHIVPRLPLPTFVTEDLSRLVPKAIFTTNPCRIQYCNREIVVFRADVATKLLQGTIHKPNKEDIVEYTVRTITSQGHLSPISLNALTVHWDFDFTLRLYPLPNLVVIGDKYEEYEGKTKGCQVVNPGSFCDAGFQFKSYVPWSDSLDDCIL